METDPLHKHGVFFDVWSHWYRLTPFGRALARVQKEAIRRLNLKGGELVLDLGCGPGDGMRQVGAQGAKAVGLDYSEGMLTQAKGRVVVQGRLARGDAGRLPFRDGAFDRIVCTNSFHHYPERLSSLKEMRRVLKKGGQLVLVDPRKDSVFGRAAIELVEKRVFGLAEVGTYTLEEWRQLCRDAGFAASNIAPGPIWWPVARAEVFVEAWA
ncbi:MAG: class I SAM-dependent methyltransferase [Myxococcaceae bacterium]